MPRLYRPDPISTRNETMCVCSEAKLQLTGVSEHFLNSVRNNNL